MACEHKTLAPKPHPSDGIERPTCVECGTVVIRGEGGVTVSVAVLMAILGEKAQKHG